MQEIYTGIDIGTHTTKVAIAEERLGGELRILGIGAAKSDGVTRGNIANIDKTQRALVAAIADAEKMADIEVKEAYLAVGGDRLRTFSSRGVIAVPKDQEAITPTNVSEVLQAARAIVIPAEAAIVDSIVREFVVDGQGGITDPVGMTGVRMEADVGLLMVPKTSLSNLERTVERAGIIPDGQAAAIRGTGLAVLTEDEAEIGAALLDIGCGTTTIGVFRRGTLVWAYSFGYAGESVTKDLMVGLSSTFDSAEQLKLSFGCALENAIVQSEMISVPGIGGRESRHIERRSIAQIMEPRLEEILFLAKDALFESDLLGKLTAGLVLTGGTSSTPELVGLAERVFEMPVRTGKPSVSDEAPEFASDPQFAGVIGAVLAASERRHRAELVEEEKSFWARFRKWFVKKI